jgi:hypothetical protein
MVDENEPDLSGRPALDRDGQLTGRIQRLELREGPPEAEAGGAPIELVDRPRAVKTLPRQVFRDPVEPRGRRARVIAAVVAILALGASGAALLLWKAGPPEDGVRASSALEATIAARKEPVLVDSEPPGATVRIAGQVVGTTPWAGDNLWGDAEVALSLPGYAPWKGRLRPRAESRFSVTLKRR